MDARCTAAAATAAASYADRKSVAASDAFIPNSSSNSAAEMVRWAVELGWTSLHISLHVSRHVMSCHAIPCVTLLLTGWVTPTVSRCTQQH